MVAIIVVGAIVTKIRHYVILPTISFHFSVDSSYIQVPFMVLSTIVGSIGTGLLSTIGLGTSTVRWASYMVITGVGIGIGVQLPYTAVQVVSK